MLDVNCHAQACLLAYSYLRDWLVSDRSVLVTKNALHVYHKGREMIKLIAKVKTNDMVTEYKPRIDTMTMKPSFKIHLYRFDGMFAYLGGHLQSFE